MKVRGKKVKPLIKTGSRKKGGNGTQTGTENPIRRVWLRTKREKTGFNRPE